MKLKFRGSLYNSGGGSSLRLLILRFWAPFALALIISGERCPSLALSSLEERCKSFLGDESINHFTETKFYS